MYSNLVHSLSGGSQPISNKYKKHGYLFVSCGRELAYIHNFAFDNALNHFQVHSLSSRAFLAQDVQWGVPNGVLPNLPLAQSPRVVPWEARRIAIETM